MTVRKRLRRWSGLVRVGVRRTMSRAVTTDRRRILLSVLGVAAIVALLVVVTGIGFGLATGSTIYDDDVDYWIAPETDTQRSTLLATDNPRFGSAHDGVDQFRTNEIQFATPVLSNVMRIEANGTSEYVLVVGVVDEPGLETVAGVTTEGLTNGDPYYANGTYDGRWTGDVVLSNSAAELLEAEPGTSVSIDGNESFTVVGTDDGTGSMGDLPVAVVQLGELQELVGAAEHDQADQFVVGANSPAIENDLAAVYPQSEVLTRGQLTTTATMDSELPLALALTALVVSVSVGALFVLTTNGLEVVADRTQLATMGAIGISTRSQLALVGVQTLVVTGLGGLVGSLLGLVGIRAVNSAAMRTLTTERIALSDPRFVPYGVVVALLIGLLSVPYLLVLTRRVSGGVPR